MPNGGADCCGTCLFNAAVTIDTESPGSTSFYLMGMSTRTGPTVLV